MSRREEIVRAARALLEEEGIARLTMRRLADRLGIRAPSLYKHLPDKEALEAELVVLALAELAETSTGAADLRALARAYRAWALAHPHLYRLAAGGPLQRERLPAGLEERAAAPLLALAGSADRARAIRAFAHGMVDLELTGRFPPHADVDAAWEAGIALFEGREGVGAPEPRRAVVRSLRGPD